MVLLHKFWFSEKLMNEKTGICQSLLLVQLSPPSKINLYLNQIRN